MPVSRDHKRDASDEHHDGDRERQTHDAREPARWPSRRRRLKTVKQRL
jgi:hypothetical protein